MAATKIKVGDTIKCHGLDMDCKPTIETAIVVRIQKRDKYGRDCVTLGSDGIRVLLDSRDFIGGSK